MLPLTLQAGKGVTIERVLHNDGHSLSVRVELEHVQQLPPLFLAVHTDRNGVLVASLDHQTNN
jgi:hypothetical protein